MSRKLSQILAEWIDQELDKTGEEIIWEITPAPHPGGAMNVALICWMPGALLNSVIHSVTVIQNPTRVDQAEVAKIVQGCVEALRGERSKQLAEANGGGQGVDPEFRIRP